MKITPTPITAALAGIVAAAVMPAAWSRWGDDTIALVLAFLALVAFPAHAFVVGLGRPPADTARGVDAALLKRVAAWVGAAVATFAVMRMLGG